jgi:LacI family transcriptional regulator
MREVADRAGVSLSTVSRVVNEDVTVGDELAARVRAAIGELGYRRDLTASSLRRADRLSALVGLLFDDVANRFFSALHRAVEQVARRRGVLTLAGTSEDDAAREREVIEAFAARRVDGIIVSPVGPDHRYLERELDAGIGIVFVDRPAHGLDIDSVMVDHLGGARAGVAHLIAAGHRRIGYLGDRRNIYSARQRLDGYRLALAAAGIPDDPALVRMDVRGASLAAAEVDGLLDLPDPPTALFTAQNLLTMGAARTLRRRGLGHRIAHVGFDDLELADVLEPGLTVVTQEAAAIGRAAAELLFARIDGDRGPPRHVVEPTRLVVRGSGEIRPPG